MAVRLGDIAAFLGAELKGDPGRMVEGVAPLASAGPAQLSFLSNPKYASQLQDSRAGVFLLAKEHAAKAGGRDLLVSANPYRDFARLVAKYFDVRQLPEPGVHPSAVVHAKAKLGSGVRVGALVVIEEGAVLGDGCTVFAHGYIGPGVRLGKDCLLHPQVTLIEGVSLGERVIIQSGAVLGGDGFGFAPDPPHGYVKVPQTGGVVVEDDVEIQANACIDRGALGPTVIGRGVKIDNLVQVAHNVEIGEHSVLASQSGISGSTKLGRWVTMAGQSATAGHLHIGDQAIVTGQAGAGKDVPAKAMVSGSPAQPTLEHHRGLAELGRLPELKKRIKELEGRLAELEKKLA